MGFWEVVFVIVLFFGIIIISRFVERARAKRICPACGLVIRTHIPTCPSCHFNFSTKDKKRIRH